MHKIIIMFLLLPCSVFASSQTSDNFDDSPRERHEQILPVVHFVPDVHPDVPHNEIIQEAVLPENPEELIWQDDDGRTPLHHALKHEPSINALQEFLAGDVNHSLLRIADHYGQTPFHVAVEECQVEAISLFLDHDNQLLHDNAFSILQTIASNSSIESLTHLVYVEPKLLTEHLHNGATAIFGAFYIDTHTGFITANNPMIAYLCRNNPELIMTPLAANIRIGNHTISSGTTPLALAYFFGFQSTHRLLMQLNSMEQNGTLEFFSW